MKLKKIYNEALGKLEYLELVHDVVADELVLEVIYEMYDKMDKIVGMKRLAIYAGLIFIIGEEYIQIEELLDDESICIGHLILYRKKGLPAGSFEIKNGVGLIK